MAEGQAVQLQVVGALQNNVGGTATFPLVIGDPATTEKLVEINAHYIAAIEPLAQRNFWNAATDVDWRPENGLWLPQRRAAEFAHAYLAACATGAAGEPPEAALIKMPTGTGKTGVIAALACASPSIAKTLVITPRHALVRQMQRDLSFRFWDRIGAIYQNDQVSENVEKAAREAIEAAFISHRNPQVRLLERDQVRSIWDGRQNDRQIIVSTFNALHLTLGIVPPAHRRFHGRTPRAPSQALANLDPAKTSEANRTAFADYLKSFDLVIVDEGHYEPAVSWAQAVRALGLPTLIFSATPYRNDYKYFNVNGRFAFNLPWQDAIDHQLVRDVEIAAPLVAQPAPPANGAPAPGGSTADAFAAACQAPLEALPVGKRAIVHAASFERLVALQEAFERIGEDVLLIHDAHRAKTGEALADLSPVEGKLERLRFRHVKDAIASDFAAATRVWMHQYKLLEGVDDASFSEAWLYDPLPSARQFIQQVGRIIRRPDLNDEAGQQATVRANGDAISRASTRTIAMQAAERWDDYKRYETYIAEETTKAFVAETQLLAMVRQAAPDVQYVAREFRRGHLVDDGSDMSAFLVPRRATVCRVRGVVDHQPGAISDERLGELALAACEAMEVEERFDIRPVAPPEAADNRYHNVRLIRYFTWQSSPLLKEHHLPEWRMGLMAIARAGRYIFLLDSEHLCVDTNRLGLIGPAPEELKRLFPASDTRIVETSASGLDIGEFGLRSLTVRKHALDQGYFDLAEASQVPTSIRGYGPLVGTRARRRLSLSRAAVADASYAPIGVADWAEWTTHIAAMLADDQIGQHRYFSRFAEQQKPLAPPQAVPQSILLDLWDILEASEETLGARAWDVDAATALLDADSCCLVHNIGSAEHPKYEFDFAGHKVKLDYLYRDSIPASGRYRLSSAALNHAVRGNPVAEQVEAPEDAEAAPFGARGGASLTGLLNQEQSFRIIPTQAHTVYAHGSFYKPKIDPELFSIFETSNLLGQIVSEKGDTRITQEADWGTRTLFGLVENWLAAPNAPAELFARDIWNSNLVICDDDKRETADFYCIDDINRRVLVVHSKADAGPATATARKMQEVGRQAQASLAYAGSSAGAMFDLPNHWKTDWSVQLQQANDAVISRSRLFRAPAGMTIEQAHEQLKRSLTNPAYSKEVVIQTAGIFSAAAARQSRTSTVQTKRQFLYYLAAVRTSFDRAGVKLRIVCNP